MYILTTGNMEMQRVTTSAKQFAEQAIRDLENKEFVKNRQPTNSNYIKIKNLSNSYSKVKNLWSKCPLGHFWEIIEL